MKRTSERQKLINDCLNLIRAKLIRERGARCEICGRESNDLGLFHIIRRSQSPRLMLNTFNILLACWMPCHYAWHHNGPNDPRNERTVKRIKELRTADYMELLYEAEAIAPKMTLQYLRTYYVALKTELT